MARRPAPGTRERILTVAARLFREHGVRAVGMQQVVDETGLGKSLLYREFASKDELVAAWLRDSDRAWWTTVDAVLEQYDAEPARQLLAFVEVVYRSVRAPGFHGCVFYNTGSEFREAGHPAHQEALAHLERTRARLHRMAVEARADDPAALADALMLLVAGLYASAAALGADGPARHGVDTARLLITQHCAFASTAG